MVLNNPDDAPISQDKQLEGTQAVDKEVSPPAEAFDYKKGYEELRAKFTQVSQERAELQRSLDTLSSLSAYDEGEEPLVEEEEVEVDQKGVALLQKVVGEAVSKKLKEVLAPVTLRSEVESFAQTFPDFGEYASQMSTFLQQNPSMKALPNRLEIAYKVAKMDKLSEALAKAKEAGTREAIAIFEKSSAPFVESGSRAVTSEPEITREWIASLSPAEYAKNRDKILLAEKEGKIK